MCPFIIYKQTSRLRWTPKHRTSSPTASGTSVRTTMVLVSRCHEYAAVGRQLWFSRDARLYIAAGTPAAPQGPPKPSSPSAWMTCIAS